MITNKGGHSAADVLSVFLLFSEEELGGSFVICDKL